MVSEVVPAQHQASGLWAALMSSPEWLPSWWRWSILSPPPRSTCPALIGGRRKRHYSITGDNALVKSEEEKNLFPPHHNANLITPIIICRTGLSITSANMSYAWGEGHVWSERSQVFCLEGAIVSFAKYQLLFRLHLIILLVLNIKVFLSSVSLMSGLTSPSTGHSWRNREAPTCAACQSLSCLYSNLLQKCKKNRIRHTKSNV